MLATLSQIEEQTSTIKRKFEETDGSLQGSPTNASDATKKVKLDEAVKAPRSLITVSLPKFNISVQSISEQLKTSSLDESEMDKRMC